MSTALLVHQIDSACDVVAYGCQYLANAINDNGFIADGSYADLRLANYAKNLRDAADKIDARRAALLANEPVPFLQAAE